MTDSGTNATSRQSDRWCAGLNDRQMSRSAFLRLMAGAAAGVGFGGLASACSSGSSGISSGSNKLPSPAPVSGTVGGQLNYLGWQGYDFPGPTKPWLTSHNAHLKSAYIATWPDVPPKIRSGQTI